MGPDAGLLRECPVGLVLREGPHIYQVINAHAYAENGAINPLGSPHYLQQGLNVVGSEKARLRDIKDEERQLHGDRDTLKRALSK